MNDLPIDEFVNSEVYFLKYSEITDLYFLIDGFLPSER